VTTPPHSPGLVTIIQSYPVTVAQAKVASLPECDDSITITIALVIHSHPVGSIITVSNDPLQYCNFNTSPEFIKLDGLVMVIT